MRMPGPIEVNEFVYVMVWKAMVAVPNTRSCLACDCWRQEQKFCTHWQDNVPIEAIAAGCDEWQDNSSCARELVRDPVLVPGRPEIVIEPGTGDVPGNVPLDDVPF